MPLTEEEKQRLDRFLRLAVLYPDARDEEQDEFCEANCGWAYGLKLRGRFSQWRDFAIAKYHNLLRHRAWKRSLLRSRLQLGEEVVP